MKTAAVLFLSIFLLGAYVQADPIVRQYYTNKADVAFAWDYSISETDLAGFKLYTMPAGTTTPTVTDIPDKAARTFKWTAFPDGQWIAYMTAYDRYGNQSDNSEWIQVNKKTTKPPAPDNNRVDALVVINMP